MVRTDVYAGPISPNEVLKWFQSNPHMTFFCVEEKYVCRDGEEIISKDVYRKENGTNLWESKGVLHRKSYKNGRLIGEKKETLNFFETPDYVYDIRADVPMAFSLFVPKGSVDRAGSLDRSSYMKWLRQKH